MLHSPVKAPLSSKWTFCAPSLMSVPFSCVAAANNIVKCRPPGNRDPQPQEQDACFGWLERQLRLLQPSIIVCLGRIAAMRLIRPDFRITREHGQWFERNGVRYLAMYHPSALLRDPARRPETYTDLLTLSEAVRTLGPLPNA